MKEKDNERKTEKNVKEKNEKKIQTDAVCLPSSTAGVELGSILGEYFVIFCLESCYKNSSTASQGAAHLCIR